MNPILVVDDNEQICSILAQYIRRDGMEAILAKSARKRSPSLPEPRPV